MSLRRFFVAGPCWTGDCKCRDFDGLDERPDLRPPLHDDCVCYLAEERREKRTALFVHCAQCVEASTDEKPLEIGLLEDRVTLEITCREHGLVCRFTLADRVEGGCHECGEGSSCRH